LKEDPTLAVAAYNLCVITARDRISEAVTWCRKAAELRPQDPKYAYTLAFYLNQKGDREEAVRTFKGNNREVSGVQRCRDASPGNIKKGEKAIEGKRGEGKGHRKMEEGLRRKCSEGIVPRISVENNILTRRRT